jgi:hypothetical protein
MGASNRKGLCPWFMPGEIEPSFKDFLASLAWMRFQVLNSLLLVPQ